MVMREQTEMEKQLEKEVYVDRLLVLLEQDDGFRQVRLTPQMFKAMSAATCFKRSEPNAQGIEMVEMSFGEQLLPKEPFEGMRDFYEEEDFG